MCGARNSSGYPTERNVNPNCLKNALDILKQKQRFVDWTIGDDVINRAKVCFRNGEPFVGGMGRSLNHLANMKIVRNRIAHISGGTNKAFQNLVRQEMGHGQKGMVPGKFLMEKIPPTSTTSLLQNYGNILLTAARIIVS